MDKRSTLLAAFAALCLPLAEPAPAQEGGARSPTSW